MARRRIESRLGEREFQANYRALDTLLARKYNVNYSMEVPAGGCDCYVQGDNFGDRTQAVHICNPAVLTPELLKYIQQFLRSDWPRWRVIIYVGGPNEHVVIYSDIIKINPNDENDLAGFCQRMQQWITHVQPHLLDGLVQAEAQERSEKPGE